MGDNDAPMVHLKKAYRVSSPERGILVMGEHDTDGCMIWWTPDGGQTSTDKVHTFVAENNGKQVVWITEDGALCVVDIARELPCPENTSAMVFTSAQVSVPLGAK